MVTLEYYDNVYLRIVTEDRGIFKELYEAYTFEVEGAKFSQAYIQKHWDGKLHLLNSRTGLIYAGLNENIIQYCKDNDIEVTSNINTVDESITREKIQKFVDSFEMMSHGERIIPHDYQVEAVYRALRDKRLLCVSPTGCLDPNTEIKVDLSDAAINFLRSIRQD